MSSSDGAREPTAVAEDEVDTDDSNTGYGLVTVDDDDSNDDERSESTNSEAIVVWGLVFEEATEPRRSTARRENIAGNGSQDQDMFDLGLRLTTLTLELRDTTERLDTLTEQMTNMNTNLLRVEPLVHNVEAELYNMSSHIYNHQARHAQDAIFPVLPRGYPRLLRETVPPVQALPADFPHTVRSLWRLLRRENGNIPPFHRVQ